VNPGIWAAFLCVHHCPFRYTCAIYPHDPQTALLASTTNDELGQEVEKISLPFAEEVHQAVHFDFSGLEGACPLMRCLHHIPNTLQVPWQALDVMSLSAIRKVGDFTEVLSGHSLCNCPESSVRSSVSPNTNMKHASHHSWTLRAPEAPHEVYFTTRVFKCAGSSSVHCKSRRCAISFGIRTSGFPLDCFDYEHPLIVHGFVNWIIRYAASCWASSSLVWIACINLFTAESNASAPCFSITLLSSESSGPPETAILCLYTSHRVYGIPV